MKTLIKSIPKPVYWLAALTIAIISIGAVAWMPAKALHLQIRAGQLLEDYIEEHTSGYRNFYTCQLPVLTDLPLDSHLKEAVVLLETARAIRPQNAHTHYQLGRAYCLSGDYDSALEAFDTFNQLKPDNPLGYLEIAFTHMTIVLTAEEQPTHQRLIHETRSKEILSDLGLTDDFFLEQAALRFRRSDYRPAWFWYRLAHTFQPLDAADVFRTAVMDLTFGYETSFGDYLDEVAVMALDGPLVMPPDQFMWLNNGNPVRQGEEEGLPSAIYRSNSEKGIVFLHLEEDGRYCVTVLALDRPPQPTRIELTLDLDRVILLELPNGDDAWRTFKFELPLEEGLHLLGVRLTNLETVDDVARYGFVGTITLTPCGD